MVDPAMNNENEKEIQLILV